MNFSPSNLPELAPADLPQLETFYTGYDSSLAQQAYALYDVNEAFPFTLSAPLLDEQAGEQVANTQFHAPYPASLSTVQPGHAQYDVAFADNGEYWSAAPVEPAPPMGPPARPRKRKAPTLRADDWGLYKNRILDLHISQNLPLPKVRQMIEEEYGFKAELRQYRTRISQWGKDKNVKKHEMKAIVRKHQKRKLDETNKGPLAFEVRGNQVELQKIERWMKRHEVEDNSLYAPSPAASTPSAVGCHTISERGSPAMISVSSPAFSILSPVGIARATQSPQMPSPALSVSSIVRSQVSVFVGQSPTLTHRSLPDFQSSSILALDTFENHMDVDARPRYKEDEEKRLWKQLPTPETPFASSPLKRPDVLYELGIVLLEQGRYRTAEIMTRMLVESRESQSSNGEDDAEMLKAWALLGRVLDYQGLYVKAERLHRRVLQGRVRMLGHEHPDTLASMNNLASALDDQGKYGEAEVIARKTLALRKIVLGPKHLDTLQSMNLLAVVLSNNGMLKEAEAMHRETLALRKTVLGPEHPHTLNSMDNLALMLSENGMLEEAEAMYRETLALYKKVLGPEHPDTLNSMNNLALVLSENSMLEEAEAMYRETLALRKKVLGPEHPDTLVSMNNLAVVLSKNGMLEEAEAMHRETLALCKTVLGPEHPNTLSSMDNLAFVLSKNGMLEEAEAMHRETLALYKTVLRPEHPNTLSSMDNLAFVLSKNGILEEAEAMYRETLALCKTVLGPEHPNTLSSMDNLAFVLSKNGMLEEAEAMHRETLVLRKTLLGPEHPDTLASSTNLLLVSERLGRYREVPL
ncbi:hypothetical protein N0V90_001121 [Kalmusia sp. IMI 367209]|nr:hypothetical protein N0V90_001121 [Kalmusia sp. IMI 367209]